MAGGLVMGGKEAERLMFVDTQPLKHDKMRSQLRKNIIMPLKRGKKITKENKARGVEWSFRGSQHLPPLICFFNINKTQWTRKNPRRTFFIYLFGCFFLNMLHPIYHCWKTPATPVMYFQDCHHGLVTLQSRVLSKHGFFFSPHFKTTGSQLINGKASRRKKSPFLCRTVSSTISLF